MKNGKNSLYFDIQIIVIYRQRYFKKEFGYDLR